MDTILKTCAICADARHTLGVSGLRLLFGKLRFSASMFSKLAKIGADARMYREDLQIHLPPDYSTLYLVCRLSDIKLDAALKDGVIRPDMHRKDLEHWAKPPREKSEA
ncbi:MAG TPA: hypothetical protein VHV26_08620, partial [Rhizomicrobium sp.]|nr:hypothetical protein [Rhizomicrobium sp.]